MARFGVEHFPAALAAAGLVYEVQSPVVDSQLLQGLMPETKYEQYTIWHG